MDLAKTGWIDVVLKTQNLKKLCKQYPWERENVLGLIAKCKCHSKFKEGASLDKDVETLGKCYSTQRPYQSLKLEGPDVSPLERGP